MPAIVNSFPWDDTPSYEADWRDMMENMRSTGIIVQGPIMDGSTGDCAVSPGTGLQVKVAPGKAWVKGHMWKHTADYIYLPIDANTSGSSRTDLIVLRVDFTNNFMTYTVIQGPYAVPINNSTTWDLPLAEVTVPNNASSISAADIKDRRVTSNHAGFRPICILRNSTSKSLATGTNATLSWDTEELNPVGMHLVSDRITIREDGVYEVGCSTVWETVANSDNLRRIILFRNRGGTVDAIAHGSSRGAGVVGVDVGVSARRVIDLQKDDYVYVTAYNDSGATLNIKASGLYSPVFWCMKLGESKGL
ncbi:hypothetical protein CLV36_11423 [Laceyella sediminis]|uniref:Minor tail protein n=1 Tax=Laceyella sediminis TaxID=573074 RepID=A0ABX5ELI0_9BACL|nr:hypothetical protein [Laceyella sediminis]PRZ12359.1 hypothetical protein CLV36_11423 [Laceyella sediminis]